MRTIFKYECRRLLWNRGFLGLLGILLFYGWQVLTKTTILGVSHTAPFSPWSFGDYLGRMLPFLWAGSLFSLAFFTSPKARRQAALTAAAPMAPWRYAAARGGAVLLASALLALGCFIEALLFYDAYFQWHAWEELAAPGLAVLVPALAFALGSGWLLSKARHWLLYLWMLVPFICRLLPLPKALELWNGNFFTEYPLALAALDPPFSLPAPVLLAQCALLACGAACAGGALLAPSPGRNHPCPSNFKNG